MHGTYVYIPCTIYIHTRYKNGLKFYNTIYTVASTQFYTMQYFSILAALTLLSVAQGFINGVNVFGRRIHALASSQEDLIKIYTSPQKDDIKSAFAKNSTYTVGKDDKGYEIKARDWFNGLSSDPGDSMNDPRAVPPPAKAFADKVKQGSEVAFKDTMAMIDEYYEYFEVPFTCGDLLNKPKENTGSAKIFSFALLNRMDEKQTLGLFGEIARNLSPSGTDHGNIRNFLKYGWKGVQFNSGLAIASKLLSHDDTDSAMKTQSVVEGSAEWDPNSDSWIP